MLWLRKRWAGRGLSVPSPWPPAIPPRGSARERGTGAKTWCGLAKAVGGANSQCPLLASGHLSRGFAREEGRDVDGWVLGNDTMGWARLRPLSLASGHLSRASHAKGRT